MPAIAIDATVPVKTKGGANKKAKKRLSKKISSFSNRCLIKPFERPPELPPDFYDANVNALRRAARCVLQRKPLLARGGGGEDDDDGVAVSNVAGGKLIGREELYRSVEDLCVHKFGPRLYRDVVGMLDSAAAEVVLRLTSRTAAPPPSSPGGATVVNPAAVASLAGAGGSGEAFGEGSVDAAINLAAGAVLYRASNLISSLCLDECGGAERLAGGPTVRMPVASVCKGAESDQVVSDGVSPAEKRYALLRRMHAVCRISYAEEYLTFVRSIFLALDRAYVYYTEDEDRSDPSYGAAYQAGVLEQGANNPNKIWGGAPKGKVIDRSSHGTNPRAWGLWEVGIACLRRHMIIPPRYSSTMEVTNEKRDEMSIIEAMVRTTACAILSEYDGAAFSSPSSSAAAGDVRPLVRNCVRTIIDLGALPSLLEELVLSASMRFEREGKGWGMALAEQSSPPVNNRTAPAFLRHVESRLKQSSGLTSYYLPSNASAAAAMRRLANRQQYLQQQLSRGNDAGGRSPYLKQYISAVLLASANMGTRRVLAAIVEAQLLSPHLVRSGLLRPHHLYPMLDDDGSIEGGIGGGWRVNAGAKSFEDAKRLYGLCRRLVAISQLSSSAFALDGLRTAFGEYGRIRGAEITKQGLSDGSGGTGSSGTKELEKKVIPDLLAFKAHLQFLHTIAFRSDEAFGTTIRSILADVLNGVASGSGGDGGRRIAELLAKYVDARFRDAKAQAAGALIGHYTGILGSPSSVVAGTVAPSLAAVDPNEAFQSAVLSLFRHVHSKDVFEAFYKRDLAKRLLTGRSTSDDNERSFLSKLKAECGTSYTSKMEGMFKDMELSRDIMSSYAAYSSGATNATSAMLSTVSGARQSECPCQEGPGVASAEMDVQVLTTGYWPVYPQYPNLVLPPEILSHKSKFESYYKNKYQGRRIAWQHSLGNCLVGANFPKHPQGRDLVVNLCQTLVLLLFKDQDGPDGRGLTIGEIMKKTGIDDKQEAERVLQSLALGRDGTRVLKKEPFLEVNGGPMEATSAPSPTSVSGNEATGMPLTKHSSRKRMPKKTKEKKSVGPNDRFIFDASFTSNQHRIKITNISMKETAEEKSKTHDSVSKDRLYAIDAAVVRIMKARKTIDHRMLMGEVMAQLKFPGTAIDVKKRIESLIEREYMERVDGNGSKYNYLA